MAECSELRFQRRAQKLAGKRGVTLWKKKKSSTKADTTPTAPIASRAGHRFGRRATSHAPIMISAVAAPQPSDDHAATSPPPRPTSLDSARVGGVPVAAPVLTGGFGMAAGGVTNVAWTTSRCAAL